MVECWVGGVFWGGPRTSVCSSACFPCFVCSQSCDLSSVRAWCLCLISEVCVCVHCFVLLIVHFVRHPALQRAAAATPKCSTFVPREPMFVRQDVVAKITELRHVAPQQVSHPACVFCFSCFCAAAGVVLLARVGGVRVHAACTVGRLRWDRLSSGCT